MLNTSQLIPLFKKKKEEFMASWPGIEHLPTILEREVWTTGQPEKSLILLFSSLNKDPLQNTATDSLSPEGFQTTQNWYSWSHFITVCFCFRQLLLTMPKVSPWQGSRSFFWAYFSLRERKWLTFRIPTSSSRHSRIFLPWRNVDFIFACMCEMNAGHDLLTPESVACNMET